MNDADRLIASLDGHPGFEALVNRVKGRREVEAAALARKLLYSAEPVSDLEIAELRGRLAGSMDVITTVSTALKRLERVTEEARA